MADYKKNNHFTHSARKDFGSRPPFRGGDRGGRDFGGPKEMFDAECASCHKMTQVPFKPNGMKPVYCRDCFKPEDSRDSRAPQGRFEKKSFAPRREFAPQAARPDGRIDDLARKLDTMNATLEKLVASMEKSQRASELTEVMQKHVVAKAPASKQKVVKKKAKAKK